MAVAAGLLLSVYVTVAWQSGGETHWHEVELAQHFFAQSVCERYRSRLVGEWIADPLIPFHRDNIVSSRCGPWEPNPDGAESL